MPAYSGWRLPSPLAWAETDQAPSAATQGDTLHLIWKQHQGHALQWAVDPTERRLPGLDWRDVGAQVAPFAQLASVLGVLLYALARIAVQAFYAQLGISPETAGQSYLSTLIPVAVALGGFVLILSLLVSLVTLVSQHPVIRKRIAHVGERVYDFPPRRHRAIHPSSAQAAGVYFVSSFLLALLAIAIYLAEVVGNFHVDAYVNLALLAVIITPIVSLVIQWVISGRRPYGVISLAVGLALVLVAGFLAHQYGAHEGRAAVHGKPLHNTVAGFSFPPLSATPVRVQPINPTTNLPAASPFQQGECLLELGEANGFVVLYDVPAETVWRLPQTAVALSQSPKAKPGCNPSTKSTP